MINDKGPLEEYLRQDSILRRLSEDFGLTHTELKLIIYFGLNKITSQDCGITLGECANEMGQKPASVSKIIKKLSRSMGIMERVHCARPNDEREVNMYLTQKGQDLYQRTLELLEQQNKEKET